jgi:hypothetical protein
MNITTGAIHFSADFVRSEAYFVCELQNLYDTGGIYIKSNIISIEGYSDKEVNYIDKQIADLTDNVVHFNQGFSINGNFSLAIKGSMEVNSHILKLCGNDEQINVYLKHDDSFNQDYFELEAIYKNNRYMITTITTSDSNKLLWIKRVDSLFQMEVV